MNLTLEIEREEDGRWLAEVPQLPGVLAYGVTREAAMATAQVLALRILAERIENGEATPVSLKLSVPDLV
jgi:predicted RNase H-like HicB family nuclease